jgi:flavin-dependent dehydrogenase
MNRTDLGEYDLVIVGGGPAGCSTALHLERLNPSLIERTILLEKSHHPREKICGGALTFNAERILNDLGITLDIPYAPVHHVRLNYGRAFFDLPEGGCAKRVIRRDELDNKIFQTVRDRGIATMEDTRVSRVIRHPNYLEIITNHGVLRGKTAVSADGVTAVLRRTPSFGPGKMARIYVAETPADPDREQTFQDRLLLIDLTYVREGLAGYYWEFPCYIGGEPFVSRGIVSGSKAGSAALLTDILERRAVPLSGARRRAWPIRHFDPSERLAQPRMILVGDAMGTDPLFSEGMSQALASGQLAAEAIDSAFRRDDLSFRRYKRNLMRSRMGKELTAYARAARLFYGRHSEFMLSLLYESDELLSLIGMSYAGTQNASERMSRLTRILAGSLLHYRRKIEHLRSAAEFEPLATTES